jgi:hypothetical protein
MLLLQLLLTPSLFTSYHPSQTVKKNSKVLVMCAVGGTLDTIVSYRRDKKLFAGGW